MNGLAPANYSMSGSPAGLARIDALFGWSMYTSTFTASPLVFGALPSLHSGIATIEALFLGHVFPRARWMFFCYVMWIWWATLYLQHHYAVDLIAGSLCKPLSYTFFVRQLILWQCLALYSILRRSSSWLGCSPTRSSAGTTTISRLGLDRDRSVSATDWPSSTTTTTRRTTSGPSDHLPASLLDAEVPSAPATTSTRSGLRPARLSPPPPRSTLQRFIYLSPTADRTDLYLDAS